MAQYSFSPGGVIQKTVADEPDDALTITRLQNVAPILDYNAFLRSLGAEHYKGEDGNMWHYAHIPIVVMEQLIQKFGPEVVMGEDVDDEVIKWIEREAPYLKVGDYSLA